MSNDPLEFLNDLPVITDHPPCAISASMGMVQGKIDHNGGYYGMNPNDYDRLISFDPELPPIPSDPIRFSDEDIAAIRSVIPFAFLNDLPKADMRPKLTLNADDLDLIRQWYNCTFNFTSPVDGPDSRLYERVMITLGQTPNHKDIVE